MSRRAMVTCGWVPIYEFLTALKDETIAIIGYGRDQGRPSTCAATPWQRPRKDSSCLRQQRWNGWGESLWSAAAKLPSPPRVRCCTNKMFAREIASTPTVVKQLTFRFHYGFGVTYADRCSRAFRSSPCWYRCHLVAPSSRAGSGYQSSKVFQAG